MNVQLPNRLCILGGGYIACEMAHYFGSLGSQVTMMVRSKLVRSADVELQQEFERVFSQKHRVLSQTTPHRVSHDGSQFWVSFGKDDHREPFDQLLVATGITPNSDWVDAKAGGLEVRKCC